MQPPLMGEHVIVLNDVRHVDIHSSRFYDLIYHLAADEARTAHVGRIGPESVEGEAVPGRSYSAQFAMRQITRVRPIADANGDAR